MSNCIKTGYLRVDPQDNSELWRISLRVAAFQDVDYGRFADEVRSLVVPLTQHYSKSWPKSQEPMVSAIFTGVVPIVYKAQRALLDSLVQSTVWSFLTITPLLMFVCRSIGGGLVAMIPNVLPILVVFGGMAWLDCPVSDWLDDGRQYRVGCRGRRHDSLSDVVPRRLVARTATAMWPFWPRTGGAGHQHCRPHSLMDWGCRYLPSVHSHPPVNSAC